MKLTKLSSLLVAFSFAVSVFVPGTFAVAATNTEQNGDKPAPKTYSTFTANLNQGEEGCKQSLQSGSIEELKAYGKDRIDKRIRTVERLDKKVDEFYKKREDTFKSKKHSAELTMNRYTPGAEKNIGTKLPADGKKSLKTKISEKKKVLEAYSKKSKSPETPDLINTICGSIFTTAIYGKLVPEVKNQMSLDNLSMKNAINATRYEATDYIYDKNKNNNKVENKLKSAKVASMVKPSTNNATLEKAQSKLNSGQDATGDISSLNATIKKQTTDINATFKQVTSIVKPAYKKSSSPASSGGSGNADGGSNDTGSGGGSNNSGGATDGSSDKKGGKNNKSEDIKSGGIVFAKGSSKSKTYSDTVCSKDARGVSHCVKYTCKTYYMTKYGGDETWSHCDQKKSAAVKRAKKLADEATARYVVKGYKDKDKPKNDKKKEVQTYTDSVCAKDKKGVQYCQKYTCETHKAAAGGSTQCQQKRQQAWDVVNAKVAKANKKK